ncbi:GNAT family N-acetyltransferase [Actinospica durhamensis]|uniref:GNAT family N-acetyltransferase n=1 Tax=Actinospica durhamensis TaxID=1508375 RepID=A0A941IQV9_9ACTN|nr:GNAT family N-acetyltransferase [Actinospica durhamensis]MBR7836699.1 GNAT family N-acetyltransferase [Actinospica durhamensis]
MEDPELEWRPLTSADAEACAALRTAAEAVDDLGESYSAEDFLDDLATSGLDAERGTLGVFEDGRMVAMGAVHARTAADPVHAMFFWATVHPDRRGRGIGAGVLAWAERAAREISALRYPGAPLRLQSPAYDAMPDHCALLESFDYRVDHYDLGMVRPISPAEADAPPQLPAGFELVPFGSEVAEEFRVTHNEAFVPDHPGTTVVPPEVFAERTGNSAFRADFTFGLRETASSALAGYVLAYHYEADTQATGRRDVYINYLATRREFRGRGVAAALIGAVLHAAAGQGFDTASLEVLAEHPTGALSLYQRLGFEARRTFAVYVKDLD